MLRKAEASLLLLAAILPHAFAVQEVWQASVHNTAISGSLLGSNLCGFEVRQPSEADMFSAAGIRAVAIVPQIDDATSDLSSPSLLWSFAADAPASAVFGLPGTTECLGGEIRLYNRSGISFSDAKMEYEYGGRKQEANLYGTGPNPVPFDLSPGPINESDFSQLYADLKVRLSAKASVSYSFRKRELFLKCEYFGNATVCYCDEKITQGRKDYARALSDGRDFLVEIGPVQELWLNPPLEKRLEGDAAGKVLFLSRRMPAKIAVAVGGGEIASATPFEFEISNGSCGEKLVKSIYAPKAINAKINRGSGAIAPYQLVEKNASYLPIYLEFGWGESAGKRQVSLDYEDWFSHSENFTRNFSVRGPEPFSANGSENAAMAIRTGDDKTSPAAYPPQEKPGALPDIAPLAALLAPMFAFGAIGLLRWMRKIAP